MEQSNKDLRIKALEQLIQAYQMSYYNGEAEISDAEFDSLWDELKQLNPHSPILAKVGPDGADGFPKIRHIIPMGSQEKAARPEEFLAWATKTAPETFVVQYKLDGASLELQYRAGKLDKAVTRGDGIIGDDITKNALRMKGVVYDLKTRFTGGVRGEVVMTRTVWQEKYSAKANCRNAANGLMRRKDGEGCEDLCFIAYDAAASEDDAFFQNETAKLAWLAGVGFSVTVSAEFASPEEVIAYRLKTGANRPNLPIDIDGLVVKDLKTDPKDLRRSRPERQIAFKFDLETAYSILRAVEWSESGGTYTPIGLIDPVRIAGTTVQRANLNNPGMIRALGIAIGSGVSVVKRGEIIPKIEGLAPDGLIPKEPEEAIFIPEICGTCGAVLQNTGTRLFCPNLECPKRLLHRLEKWIAVLDIRELGEKLIKQLFGKGRIRRIPDLYTLTSEELAEFDRMGSLSAGKVVRHIRTKRTLSLAAFVAAFDFEGVGETIMEKVTAGGFDTLEKLRSASVEALTEVYGLGEITAKVIAGGLTETAGEMDEVLALGVIRIADPPAETLPLRGFSFCFTGELSYLKRSEAEEQVRALGGSAKSTVVKGLSFLVTNNPDSGSGKNKKAQALGVKILDEKAFIAILQAPSRVGLYLSGEAPAPNPQVPLF
ncbi:MAG: NAD-dependent DNA ligase LigA [Spirochaetaceae bacterium]|nr:NAD-dependent DNA ligase LigA [Spirochaetaceae bacterium]